MHNKSRQRLTLRQHQLLSFIRMLFQRIADAQVLRQLQVISNQLQPLHVAALAVVAVDYVAALATSVAVELVAVSEAVVAVDSAVAISANSGSFSEALAMSHVST